ncbi:PPE family protein, partial [Mycobacterium basiliense]
MFAGAGSAPMLAAAAAWDGLADELGIAADSFAAVASGLVDQAWHGPASEAMAAAAAPYVGWLDAACVHAARAAAQAQAVTGAFEAARAATVQPVLVELNRNSLVQLAMSNWFGFNAPAIFHLESVYERMWAQDVAAMLGYHAEASAAAAQLSPAASVQELFANLGLGNTGTGNVGNGNTGFSNLGNGNIGNRNVGGGTIGNDNIGSGNTGRANIGSGNAGTGNVGFGNRGSTNEPSNHNVGLGNNGNDNIGIGNSGNGNTGGGNSGNFNTGGGN